MITIRPGNERGPTKTDWLDSRHTFSFGEYHDPRHMGFGPLRVINEDRVAPGGGFATHGHANMEIVSWVLGGELAHRDSLGTGSVIRPGDAQRMSAGSGIRHSEFNPSNDAPVHFLQIWIVPDQLGAPPAYAQRAFPESERRGRLRTIVSPDEHDGSISIRQDVYIHAALLAPGDQVTHVPGEGRRTWVQLARGRIALNDHEIAAGDGAAIVDEEQVVLRALEDAEVLLFDIPGAL